MLAVYNAMLKDQRVLWKLMPRSSPPAGAAPACSEVGGGL